MTVFVNGSPRHLDEPATIAQLLGLLQLERRGLAVELNLELIPAGLHKETTLADGDRLEIVTLVGGG